jgi:alpha-D-xyloside xylohydrolase
MNRLARRLAAAVLLAASLLVSATALPAREQAQRGTPLVLPAPLLRAAPGAPRALSVDGLFVETAQGRTPLPPALTLPPQAGAGSWTNRATLADGRVVSLSVARQGDRTTLSLAAEPSAGVVRWGLSIDAAHDEYFTGLMERVVDGPQQASWAPGITEAMDLRGQKVEFLVKPTLSVYAPFYLSSRGYSVTVRGTWPGQFDFAATDRERVSIAFEGPSLTLVINTAGTPAELVRAHAIEAGPPFLPPKWIYSPWRWRDEHTQRPAYFDGTPVAGPFNSEVMEDVLMMQAFGIPNGVYWIDRPWGVGQPWGYDDFEIDPARLPHFAEMVQWLDSRQAKTVLWITAAYNGRMASEALAKGWVYPGQTRPPNGNNYPMVDLTNPAARQYWQDGIAKLLKLGVAGFKLDRGEENIPDGGPFTMFDGRSIREMRNPYISLAAKAVYDVSRQYRGDDFFVMPRAAYAGASPFAIFWGGDIGGTQEGLRASIIGVQRAAVMGYPNWGSDTCGYNQQLLDQEVCGRWLAFSAFTPIMEVGPTRNVGFWNLPRAPAYDEVLIATWRLYARLHERLKDYSHAQAAVATKTGMPIVRPLFLADPDAPQAWSQWWTYLYGPDLVVSPVWQKGRRSQEVYLPAGATWRDAWRAREYPGGQTVVVPAEPHQIPIFVRVGSTIDLGDLSREWDDARRIASGRPDLKTLEAEVIRWFESNAGGAAGKASARSYVPAGYAGAPFGDSRNPKVPQRIPGRLQGELFDTGGPGVAYSDSDGKNSGSGALNPIDGSYLNSFRAGEAVDISYTKDRGTPTQDFSEYNRVTPDRDALYLGWTEPGEWVNYTVDVEQSGAYAVDAMYTSNGEGSFRVFVDDVLQGTVVLPTTHADADPVAWRQWHHWNRAASALKLNLQQGTHLVRLEVVVGNFNLDYLDFRRE